MKNFFWIPFLFLSFGCNSNNSASSKNGEDSSIPVLNSNQAAYKVIHIYPHDTSSFTEGIFLHDDKVYESTGEKGKSKLLVYDLKTGKTAQSLSLSPEYFGEGISIIDNKLYQLTWQSHKVFVYELPGLKKIKELNWPYEGWGMTTDGKNLMISTGSSNIYIVNPQDFSIVKTIGVTNNYGPLSMINELEYVDGAVYANVWQTDTIVKIDLSTGKVMKTLDLKNIRQDNGISPSGDVLNGIAYDSISKNLLITGKNWEKIFEIKLL